MWENVMMWSMQREKNVKRSSCMKARHYGQGYHHNRNRKFAKQGLNQMVRSSR